MRIILFFLFIFPMSGWGTVQSDEQSWINLNSFIKINHHYQAYLEAQPRWINYHHYHGTTLYRAALGKNLSHGFSTWLGYGFVERTNPSYLHEDRPFFQLMHGKDLFVGFRLINRTRFEGRYFRGQSAPAFRLRHLLRVQYRFPGSRFGSVASDEWFWHSASHRSSGISEGFDQNRFFAGLSYSFGEAEEHLGEVGYMNQYINGPVSDSNNNVLALQVTLRY